MNTKLFVFIFILNHFSNQVFSICPSNFYYNSNDSICIGRTSGINSLIFSECIYPGFSLYYIDTNTNTKDSSFWRNPLNFFNVDINQSHSQDYCPTIPNSSSGMKSSFDEQIIEIVKNKYLIFSQCRQGGKSKLGILSSNNQDESVDTVCSDPSLAIYDEKNPPQSNVIDLSKPCLSTYVCSGKFNSFQTVVNSECNDIGFNCSTANTDKETYKLIYNQTIYIGNLKNFSSNCQDVCVHGVCSNSECECYGSFTGPTCSTCLNGYELINNECVDKNECLIPNICNENSYCVNTVGNYSCHCKMGFIYKDTTNQCEDLDECLTNYPCGNGTCINTVGGFRCDCPEGFQFINSSCIDIDECSIGSNICPRYYSCINTPGSFSCICPTENLSYCQEFPTITRVNSLGKGLIEIEGEKIPSSNFSIQIGKRFCERIVFKTSNILQCTINPEYLDGENVLFWVNGVHKIVFKFRAPYIYNYSSVPTTGGKIVFNVSGIHDRNNTWIHIGSTNCSNLSFLNDFKIECSIEPGSGSSFLSLISDDQYSTDINNFYYMPPSINHTTRIYQKGGLLTIYGQNFGTNINNISIHIGNQICSNVTLIANHSTLSCISPPSKNFKDILYIIVSEQRSDDLLILFDQEYICNNLTCNNNGYCNSGVCFCNDKWAGTYCNISSSQVDSNYTMFHSNSSPKTEIITESKSNFNLNIREIREVSPGNEVLVRYDLQSIHWNLHLVKNDTWIYQVDTPNLANLTVEIEYSNETKPFKFGNQELMKSKGSLKYTISIAKWPFLKRSNHLEIILSSESILRDVNQKCSSPMKTKFGFNTNQNIQTQQEEDNNEVLWFKTNTGWSTIVAKFFNRAILDGELRNIRFTSMRNNTESTGMVDIGLIVPYFQKECIVDPDYSVLVNPTPPTIKCPNSSEDKFVLAASLTILTVFAVASISSITFYILKKKSSLKEKNLQAISQGNNNTKSTIEINK